MVPVWYLNNIIRDEVGNIQSEYSTMDMSCIVKLPYGIYTNLKRTHCIQALQT